MYGYLATSVCRFACHPHLSAFSGRFLNGFSEGKKLVACFLKLVARISKSEPLIFSLLPCGVNALKFSFQFFAPKTPVLRYKFFTHRGAISSRLHSTCWFAKRNSPRPSVRPHKPPEQRRHRPGHKKSAAGLRINAHYFFSLKFFTFFVLGISLILKT